MRMTVLFGSPRGAESNTRALLMPLLETWRQAGHAAEIYDLYDLKIEGCRACLGCQQDWEAPACVLDDDMQPIFDSILRSDLTLLATPIYSWYCTAPVKAALDRLVYAMDKYYGPRGKGPALLAGKPMRGGADLRLPAGEGDRPLCGGDAPLVPPYRYALAGQSGGAPHGLRHRVHGRRKGVSRPSLRPDAYDTADRRFCSRGASSAVTAIFSMSPGRNGSIPAHRMAETSMPLPMYPLRITAM